MAWFDNFIYMMLHIDIFLTQMVHIFGAWSYVILFLVVFFEMACILTPFLPGDSLLFAAGALAANSELHILPLMIVLLIACFTGMMVNYWIGHKLGDPIYKRANSRWLNRKHLDKAHAFFEKYGASAIIVCCFIAILRTFTPFIAGLVKMNHVKYTIVSLFGSCFWVIGLLWISYAFGNMPFVKEHFSWFVLAMIVIPSLVPVIGLLKHRKS